MTPLYTINYVLHNEYRQTAQGLLYNHSDTMQDQLRLSVLNAKIRWFHIDSCAN